MINTASLEHLLGETYQDGSVRMVSVAPMLRLVIWTNREPLKTKENKSQQDAT